MLEKVATLADEVMVSIVGESYGRDSNQTQGVIVMARRLEWLSGLGRQQPCGIRGERGSGETRAEYWRVKF